MVVNYENMEYKADFCLGFETAWIWGFFYPSTICLLVANGNWLNRNLHIMSKVMTLLWAISVSPLYLWAIIKYNNKKSIYLIYKNRGEMWKGFEYIFVRKVRLDIKLIIAMVFHLGYLSYRHHIVIYSNLLSNCSLKTSLNVFLLILLLVNWDSIVFYFLFYPHFEWLLTAVIRLSSDHFKTVIMYKYLDMYFKIKCQTHNGSPHPKANGEGPGNELGL